MTNHTDLSSWKMDLLEKRCAEESKRFYQRKSHDTRFCLEMFRRAFVDQDQEAWEYLYRQYQPLVSGWLENHALFPSISEEKEYFINRAYEKMWHSLTKEKFERFTELSAVLHYLKMCVGSVIIDYVRAQDRIRIEEFEGNEDLVGNEAGSRVKTEENALEDIVFNQIQSQDLWKRVKSLATSTKEHCVLYGSFLLGLKPREIVEAYPGEFEGVQEVYRVKEYLVDRLRRNQELIKYLTTYAEEMG
jgi:DNA-directed RNA polymerase specialized sigma24 family protein